jgi:hypothetical protein
MSRKSMLVLFSVLCALSALFAGGCATTDGESDQPWNMSQPWETAPGIPGLNSP